MQVCGHRRFEPPPRTIAFLSKLWILGNRYRGISPLASSEGQYRMPQYRDVKATVRAGRSLPQTRCLFIIDWSSGSSSVVERDLAKVDVAGSTPVSRSSFLIHPLADGLLPAGTLTYPAGARYPSGKGEVCKTFMRRFDSDPRLQNYSHTVTEVARR
jgi:hypothetical protein